MAPANQGNIRSHEVGYLSKDGAAGTRLSQQGDRLKCAAPRRRAVRWQEGGVAGASRRFPLKLGAGLEPGSDYTTDQGFVYWATEDGLYKIPRAGGSATEIVAKTDRARNLAVDSRSVYWTDRGGRVQKMPK